MATVLATDPASVMRATGLVRSFIAHDDLHLNAVMAAIDGDQDALVHTLGALVGIAALMTAAINVANVLDKDVDPLDVMQRLLIQGDITFDMKADQ